MQGLLIDDLNERDVKDFETEDKKFVLVQASRIIWLEDELRKLIEKKAPKALNTVFVEKTVIQINDDNIQKLVKSKQLKLSDLEKVSEEKFNKPYIRIYDIKDDD